MRISGDIKKIIQVLEEIVAASCLPRYPSLTLFDDCKPMLLETYESTRAIVFSNKDQSFVANGHFLGDLPADGFWRTPRKWEKRKGKTKEWSRDIVTIHLLQFRGAEAAREKVIAALLCENQRDPSLFRPTLLRLAPIPLGFFRLSRRCPRFNSRMPFSSWEKNRKREREFSV